MLGEILYEAADIAFDTDRGIFFNPITKKDYGPKPPPGGWEVPWYVGTGGKVMVPVGEGGVAKSAAEVEQMIAKVTTDLANDPLIGTNKENIAIRDRLALQPRTVLQQTQNQAPVSGQTQITNQTPTISTTVETAGQTLLSKLPPVFSEKTFGIDNWMLAIIAVGVGLIYWKGDS